jgi:pimeloyl-ACP methyl ester carboxylesterase
VMSALGHEHFHVAGASMGGMIAQTMAILHSQRLRTLTSVMSGPGGRRYALAQPSALLTLLSKLPRERDAQVERLVKTFRVLHGDGLPFDEASTRALALAQVDTGMSPRATSHQLGAILESGTRRRPLLRNVTVPTLVIHGSRDPLLPVRGAVATARLIRGAELLVVRGMGHSFPAQVVPIVAGAIATHARKASA